jgi:hypothetical protein
MPPGILTRLARDAHRIFREDRRSVEQGAMVLAAVEAVAEPDAVRLPGRHDPNVSAQASAGELLHARLLR